PQGRPGTPGNTRHTSHAPEPPVTPGTPATPGTPGNPRHTSHARHTTPGTPGTASHRTPWPDGSGRPAVPPPLPATRTTRQAPHPSQERGLIRAAVSHLCPKPFHRVSDMPSG